MNDVRKRVDETLSQLRQEAEALRVKLHLAKMDAGSEWQVIEAKLRKIEAKTKELSGVSAEAAKNVGAAVTLLAEEIRDGLKKIAGHL